VYFTLLQIILCFSIYYAQTNKKWKDRGSPINQFKVEGIMILT